MALLYKVEVRDPAEWYSFLSKAIPDIDFRVWPDVGNLEDIDVALVWQPVEGDLRRYPNLKAILSAATGVDHILKDRFLPDVPICRILDPYSGQQMSEYVLYFLMRFHRLFYRIDEDRRNKVWRRPPFVETRDRTVGVLGLGNIGSTVASRIAALGFNTQGWSRTAKELGNVNCLTGTEGFEHLLRTSHVLVNALPLTAETTGILNGDAFDRMPEGSFLINIGRGQHVDIPALISRLDSGHIERAALDVFDREPLAPENPLWTHPRVEVTPHISATTNLRTASEQVIENYRRMKAGLPLLNVIDRKRGY